MFFLLPLTIFSLSMVSPYLMLAVVLLVLLVLSLVVLLNMLQRRCHSRLPPVLQTWKFLPLWMRSLAPLNDKIMAVVGLFGCKCCARCAEAGKGNITENPDSKDNATAAEESEKSGYDSQGGHGQLALVVLTDLSQLDELMPRVESTVSFVNENTMPTVLRCNCESGYATMTNTPCNTPCATPCMSRLQSYAVIPQVIHEEEIGAADAEDNAAEGEGTVANSESR